MSSTNDLSRVKTGIAGFDRLVQGGFPKGSSVLLSGSPSTGKTIFALQYLYNGAKKFDEPGLYISCEETVDSIIKTGMQFGWDFPSLTSQNKIIIRSFPEDELFLETLLVDIEKQVKLYGIKRLVIDSLTTLYFRRESHEYSKAEAHLDEQEKVKKFIFQIISRLSKFTGLTKIFISEVEGDDEHRLASETASPFLCDGIIFIKYRTMGGLYSRELVVRKMRHTHHEASFHPLEITSKGIEIRQMEE